MTTLEAIVGATTYNLSDGSIAWRVEEAGLGMSPVRRYSRRGPRQHGVSDTGYRLEPRLIQLAFASVASSISNQYTRRDQLMEIFKPSDDPIKLRWTLDNGNVRQIDAFYNGGLDFGSGGLFGLLQQVAVELYCPDPTFYDPSIVTTTIANTGYGVGLVVPMTVPLAVGESTFDLEAAITYTGSIAAYPVIRLNGPLTSPTITNDDTGEMIALTANGGASIGLGEYLEIDLTSGVKTVLRSNVTSFMPYLADTSDLATFHIAAAPESTGGANTIRATGYGAANSTSMTISYYRRYAGI